MSRDRIWSLRSLNLDDLREHVHQETVHVIELQDPWEQDFATSSHKVWDVQKPLGPDLLGQQRAQQSSKVERELYNPH
jgi:hypothetical protein